MRTFLGWLIAVVVIGLLSWGIWASRREWIEAGNVGVIYNARTGLQDKVYDPQRIYIPWRCSLYQYPTQVKSAVYTQDPTMGEVKSADGIALVTNDNANTIFDIFVFYRVRKEDVIKVFNKFGAQSIDQIQTTQLRSFTRDVANLVSTSYDIFELMGPKRAEASTKMTESLRAKMAEYGISVDYVLLGTAYPNESTMAKITERVNALTELSISGIKGEIAEVTRSRSRITTEAQTQASAIKASGTRDRSMELLQLETDLTAVKTWSGKKPLIETRPGQTVVVSGDLSAAYQEWVKPGPAKQVQPESVPGG